MMYERFQNYKKVALNYRGNKDLPTNELASLCRESAPKKWQVVSPNSLKTWKGEQRKEVVENGKKVIYMYRSTYAYDEVLFSMLIIRFEPRIYSLYRKSSHILNEDEFLDAMEEALIQSLRRFDVNKGSFHTLYYQMMNNYIANTILKVVPYRTYKTQDGKSNKEIYYNELPLSYDEIIDDVENPYRTSLPTTEAKEISMLQEMKEKVKKENHLLAWLIIDWQEDIPEISCLPIFKEMNLERTNVKRIQDVYKYIVENNLENLFGFTKTKKSVQTSSNVFRARYKEAVNELRIDYTEYYSM